MINKKQLNLKEEFKGILKRLNKIDEIYGFPKKRKENIFVVCLFIILGVFMLSIFVFLLSLVLTTKIIFIILAILIPIVILYIWIANQPIN